MVCGGCQANAVATRLKDGAVTVVPAAKVNDSARHLINILDGKLDYMHDVMNYVRLWYFLSYRKNFDDRSNRDLLVWSGAKAGKHITLNQEWQAD